MHVSVLSSGPLSRPALDALFGRESITNTPLLDVIYVTNTSHDISLAGLRFCPNLDAVCRISDDAVPGTRTAVVSLRDAGLIPTGAWGWLDDEALAQAVARALSDKDGAHRADYENVDLVLNLEARGTSGPALMFETSSNNSAVAGYFLSHVKQPVSSSLLPSLYARMPNGTDMNVLIPEGFTVLNIAAIGDAEHYHHPTDAPRYVDHSTLQHYGDQVLDLARAWAFDGQAPTLTADGDLHFFQLWRGLTVRYPAAVGTGLGCLAVIAALGADLKRSAADLARWQPYKGRGGVERIGGLTLLDDSYNANPVSVAAGLATLAAMPAGR